MGVPETHDTLRPVSKVSLNGSADSTIAASVEPSFMEKSERPNGHPAETKETEIAGSRASSPDVALGPLGKEVAMAEEEAKIETGGLPEDEIDDNVYPVGWKLSLISIALCLSVFCMALGKSEFLGHRVG
jgi:hypothetical protein